MDNHEQKVEDRRVRVSNPWYAVVIPQTSPDGKLFELLALRPDKESAEASVEKLGGEIMRVMVTLTSGHSPKGVEQN